MECTIPAGHHGDLLTSERECHGVSVGGGGGSGGGASLGKTDKAKDAQLKL